MSEAPPKPRCNPTHVDRVIQRGHAKPQTTDEQRAANLADLLR